MVARLLISPSLEERVGEINKILPKFNLSPNHPDLLYLPNDSKLGIAEARKIKEHFAFKSFIGKVKGAVLENASNLTVEAQNALLKTLEELPKDTVFILAADSEANLLPTVTSRCQIIRLQEAGQREQEKDYSQDIRRLLRMSVEQRFEYIEKLKDREEFLHNLVLYFRNKLFESSQQTYNGRDINVFSKQLLQTEQWAAQNVNIRAILEYLMLVMPSKI